MTRLQTQPSQESRTVAFVSLGCPKNLVDSEKMLGMLAEAGIAPVPEQVAEQDGADAMVINTCGFLEASKAESLEEIARAAALKRAGKIGRVVVAGCLVQRHRAKLLEWCDEIDALIGVFDRDNIVPAVLGGGASTASGVSASAGMASPAKSMDATLALPVYSSIATNATLAKASRGIDAAGYFEDDAGRMRLTPRHYAYLRISEGCNQNCAFCTIPSIRGKMRSKPVQRIIAEAGELLADGAFELNLIGQDTTSFGQDINDAGGLVGMLEALDATAQRAAGGAWLRLMYAYPSCFTDDMIDAIARLRNVVKYIDMPLQHINDDVLGRMRRHTSRQLIETLLGKLRDRIPGIAIRTTFISGFPGETEAQHNELVQFIREFGFDNLGVFGYSPEPGTPAGSMYEAGERVDDDLIAERIDALMTAQQEVVFKRHEQLAADHAVFEVLIDEPREDIVVEADDEESSNASDGPSDSRGGADALDLPADATTYAGRTYAQAPDIDGTTFVISRERLSPGELVRCRVVHAAGYDLIARPLAEMERRTALPLLNQS